MEYSMLWYSDMIGACVIALAIGCYLNAISISECLKKSLFLISRNMNDKANKSNLMDQFIESIEFHSRVKQLSILNLANHFQFEQ